MRRNPRYGDEFAPYPAAAPLAGWYPGAFWGGAPLYGWGAWGAPAAPFVPVGYGAYDRAYARRRPQESATYGRGGDRAVREWARARGYDAGYAIRPRRPGNLEDPFIRR